MSAAWPPEGARTGARGEGTPVSATASAGSAGSAFPGGGALHLRDMGSFHTAGRVVTLEGLPEREALMAEGGQPVKFNPNGEYVVEQVYVQYFLPEVRNGRLPLVFWHGGGMTGKAWETTPDGRPGWLHYFLRRGWDCYVCDAVERGRSGFAPLQSVWAELPMSQTASDIYTRFRIGCDASSYHADPARRRPYPNTQFPAEAFDRLVCQMVPRWTQTDAAILRGYRQLLEQLGRVSVICHSQGGVFGLRMAHAMPEHVRALVGLEPASVPVLDTMAQPYRTPTLIVMGDNMDTDPRWPRMRTRLQAFQAEHPDVVDYLSLPSVGEHGNSHMLMMDRNHYAVAQRVNEWLEATPRTILAGEQM